MSLATWWMWRCHALVDGCGQTLQAVVGSCRVYKQSRQSHFHDGASTATWKTTFPFGRSPDPPAAFNSSSSRTRYFPPSGASAGGAGMGSNDEGGGNRTLEALWNWNWMKFRRHMSREASWRREDDEGDWRYSPEWWGTQGGGWGRNDGEIAFEMPTSLGNGVVSVTAHPASKPTSNGQVYNGYNWDKGGTNSNSVGTGSQYGVLAYEWRVLRFNTVTRQSVAKVMAVAKDGDPSNVVLLQQPNCVAFEYVKSLISAGLSAVSLAGLDVRRVSTGLQKMRILCIGLGGGSLPLFLAHNLPGASVDTVEIDSAVISAAVTTMGFPPCSVLSSSGTVSSLTTNHEDVRQKATLWGSMLDRITIFEGDGENFVSEKSQKRFGDDQFDLVFVDAYDGEDVVPYKFWDRNGQFLSALGCVLNPDHGTVVVNLHTDSSAPSIVERLTGKFGPGYDPSSLQGKRVQEAAIAYRDVLLRGTDSWRFEDVHSKHDFARSEGLAFTVAVSLQGNISLVVSRGTSIAHRGNMNRPDPKTDIDEYFKDALVEEARKLQTCMNIPFDMAKRVSRGFQSF